MPSVTTMSVVADERVVPGLRGDRAAGDDDVAAGGVLVLVALQRIAAGVEREGAALDRQRVLAAQRVVDRRRR